MDRPPIELPHPVRMRVLGAVMIGVFLAALDQTVVGTALPRIITDLGGNGLYTWAFTAYLLTVDDQRAALRQAVGPVRSAADLPVRHRHLHGRLAAGRSVAGDVAARRRPRRPGPRRRARCSRSRWRSSRDLFAPSERGRYQGLFGAVFGLSVLVGPAIGGLITDTIGWPFVFFLNLPIGALVLAMVRRNLPLYHPAGERPRIDYLGAALFSAALVPILVGLTNKQTGRLDRPGGRRADRARRS